MQIGRLPLPPATSLTVGRPQRRFRSAKILQENHYYPFGLNLAGLEEGDEQTLAGLEENPFQFNAQSEKTLSLGLNWHETPYRPYDPQLGRFHGVDAMAEAMPGITPFHFGFNNPVAFNDPTGLAPSNPSSQSQNGE